MVGAYCIRPLIFLFCLLLLAGCSKTPEPDTFDLNAALGGVADARFTRALAPRAFQFPQDHAAHPDFRNEWWYVTGNVQTDDGRQFGYQVTWFRIALTPDKPVSASPWASNQVWMAHVALTDVQAGEHLHDQRLARGAAELAGQAVQPFRVWLEDWQMVGDGAGEFPWAIAVKAQDFTLNLQLRPQKPPVLQGDQGLSQKSSELGNASYYYSLTRLQTLGEIYRDGQRFTVTGESWLDREWSTSALGADQAGWDWFSLQLRDGHEVMFYRLRKKSGEVDAYSAGKWVLPEGTAQTLARDDVELKPLRYWQAESGARYPVAWEMRLPKQQRHWRIEAVVDDQLMQTGITYWEGAVRVVDVASGEVLGRGYLEMSGYQ
ncbi:carotenoid 1,2-hydratase [Thiothrix subterranea]|nr:carotenoid 1,2-hydratase [Thiothrix subterranea]